MQVSRIFATRLIFVDGGLIRACEMQNRYVYVAKLTKAQNVFCKIKCGKYSMEIAILCANKVNITMPLCEQWNGVEIELYY